MIDEQHRRIQWLCRQIEVERDEDIFLQLVSELNQLLEHQPNPFPITLTGKAHGDGMRYDPYDAFAQNRQIPELLQSVIAATAADFGNIQLFDRSRSGLRIVAQHGFGREFLSYFDTVCSGSFACGAAMTQHSRVTVSDILTSPLFQDIETCEIMLRARVRACQSTPLFDEENHFIGVVSTHFENPTLFDPSQWKRVDSIVSDFAKQLRRSM